jgi:hypothetical protein
MGGGRGIVFSPRRSCLPSLSVVVINQPAIHPPSSCSWGLGAGGLSFDAVVGGGGALALVIVVVVCVGGWVGQCDVARVRGPLCIVVVIQSALDPPYEQWLVGVGMLCHSLSSSNLHPRSTLQAVARRHGDGCCAIRRRRGGDMVVSTRSTLRANARFRCWGTVSLFSLFSSLASSL